MSTNEFAAMPMTVTGFDVVGGITGAEQLQNFVREMQAAGIQANVTPVQGLANVDASTFSGSTGNDNNTLTVNGTTFDPQNINVTRNVVAQVVQPVATREETPAVDTSRGETVTANAPAASENQSMDAALAQIREVFARHGVSGESGHAGLGNLAPSSTPSVTPPSEPQLDSGSMPKARDTNPNEPLAPGELPAAPVTPSVPAGSGPAVSR
jgi:hypothetical protein